MDQNGAEQLCQNGTITEGQNRVRTEVEEGDKQKVELFKALIREGKSVNKAMRESGLSTYKYQKYYDAIWSDPKWQNLSLNLSFLRTLRVTTQPMIETTSLVKRFTRKASTRSNLPRQKELNRHLRI